MAWEFLLLGLLSEGVRGYYSGKGKSGGGKFIGGKMSDDEKAQFKADKKLAAGGDAEAKKRMEAAAAKANEARVAAASGGGGNPKFQNRTFQFDADSVTTTKGGNSAAINKAADQYSKVDKIPDTSQIDITQISSTGKVSWSADKIEAVAKSIAANNGTVLKIPVAQKAGVRDGETQFKIVAGANEIKAYQRAREINPNIPDRVRIYVGDPKALEPLRTPPVVRRTGIANGEEQYEVVGNISNFRGYQQARKTNPNLPDRFRAYMLGKGESIDSLRAQLED